MTGNLLMGHAGSISYDYYGASHMHEPAFPGDIGVYEIPYDHSAASWPLVIATADYQLHPFAQLAQDGTVSMIPGWDANTSGNPGFDMVTHGVSVELLPGIVRFNFTNDPYLGFLFKIATGGPAVLNNIKYVASPVDPQDAANKQYVDQSVTAEQSARISADSSLSARIDFITNNTDPAALDSLTEIVGAFQAADGSINGAISSLAASASANLAAEQSDRMAADAAEQSARIAGDASLQAALTAEVNLRASQIADLQNSVNNSVAGSIDAEVSARMAADATLQALSLIHI